MSGTTLMGDAEVAKLLALSESCIRGQRFKRRHGLPHWFTVDPIMVGKCPRYRGQDIEIWIAALTAKGPNHGE